MSDCDVCIGLSGIEVYEPCNVDRRIARRNWRCCECDRFISPGASYEHVRGCMDGRWYTHRTCPLCVEIRDVFRCGEGFYYEMLWDTMQEDAFEHLTTASPCFRELSPEARAFVLERWRKWKGLP